jgi:hypothetical protein
VLKPFAITWMISVILSWISYAVIFGIIKTRTTVERAFMLILIAYVLPPVLATSAFVFFGSRIKQGTTLLLWTLAFGLLEILGTVFMVIFTLTIFYSQPR